MSAAPSAASAAPPVGAHSSVSAHPAGSLNQPRHPARLVAQRTVTRQVSGCRGARIPVTAGRPRAGQVCLRIEPARRLPSSGSAVAQLRRAHPAGVSRAGRSRTAAAQVTPPAQCNVAPGGWTTPDPDRLTTCEGMNYAWTASVTNSDGSQTQTGELDWTVYEWAVTSGLSGDPTWQHGMILDVTNVWGSLSSGMTAKLQSTCDSYTTACTAVSSVVDDSQTVTLTAGTSYANSWAEQDNGAAATASGQVDTFDNTIGLQYDYGLVAAVNYTPFTGVDTSDAAVPLSLRCDSIIANPDTATGNLDGCVNQRFAPTFVVNRTTSGASADMIAWAQAHLSAGWGERTPLHRLADPNEQDANRAVVCPDSLVRDPDIYLASCDEFPFAATRESAGMPGSGVTDGSQCAQLTAVQTGNSGSTASQWAINDLGTPPGTYNSSAKCVRSMVPKPLNSDAGLQLGRFYTRERVADGEAFYVMVTPPTGAVALPVPTNFTVVPVSTGTLQLTWTDNTGGAAQYEISTGGAGPSTFTPAGAASYTVTGLTPGNRYCYRIRAFTTSRWSAFTPSVSPYVTCATAPLGSSVPPAAPTNVAGSTPNSYTTHLTWTDNSGGTAQFEISNGSTSVQVAAGTTSFDWGGQSPGTTSCFQVRAFTDAGASAWAPDAPGLCVTTPAASCQSSLNTPDSAGYLDFYHGTSLAYAQDIQANGIDLTKSDPDTDFGMGFYVTTSLSQAQQWARKNFRGQTPSVVHFRIPASSLAPGSLCGLVFPTSNPPADFFSFTKWIGLHTPPIGGAGYDFVEGPLLLNRAGFLAGQPPIIGGQQDSFHTAAGVAILDRGFTEILPVPTGQYPLTIHSTANDNYVSAELGYTGNDYAMLRARAAAQGPWEMWTAVVLSNGEINLQSPANGNYVSAELGYTGNDYAMLRARASVAGPWESFQLVPNADGTYSLQSTANGNYVSAELGYTGDSYAELRAGSVTIGPREEFTDDAEPYSACTTCE
ncbi:MAG: fibronectin type III domain-containing protein [Streptosporangiaceae bacterium]|nr:fibronectin type III domain-containing protein [Streptosporangiaceae bacterium]